MTRIRNQRGFLLAEIVLATTLLSVALLTVAYMFIHAGQSKAASAGEAAAAALAQKQLELLKERTAAEWSATAINSYIDWQDAIADKASKSGNVWVVPVNNTNYIVSTQVQICSGNSNLTQVAVTVNWTETDATAVSRALTVTAFYSKI